MKRHYLDLVNKKYSEKELEDNINLFDANDWINISEFQKLSKQFIEKYEYRVFWITICYCQDLSESFLEKNLNKIDWCNISECQNLSEVFIRKHINKININCLMRNKNLSGDLKYKIKKEIETLKEII